MSTVLRETVVAGKLTGRQGIWGRGGRAVAVVTEEGYLFAEDKCCNVCTATTDEVIIEPPPDVLGTC